MQGLQCDLKMWTCLSPSVCVLAFPGIFRGAFDAGATDITENMKIAAARAIADSVSDEDLEPGFVVPSVFDKSVPYAVAEAVAAAAMADGVCRT